MPSFSISSANLPASAASPNMTGTIAVATPSANNAELVGLYRDAKAGGAYDKVERFRGPGRGTSVERAYAMTTPQEYFAEGTEAYFLRNDFAPFDRDALRKLDARLLAFIEKVWAP